LIKLAPLDKDVYEVQIDQRQSQEGFRRLTGVKRTTFDVMTNILSEADVLLKSQEGKPKKLAIEDTLGRRYAY
jgi:hypothetical protein